MGNSHKEEAAKPMEQVADLTRHGDGAHREGRRERGTEETLG